MTPRKSLPALVLALLVATLPACTDRPGTEQEVEIAVPHASAKECKPSVHPFWAKFREAILKEDWEAVAGMTEFPLMVVRFGDAKKIYLSRQDFIKYLPQFLNAPHGEKLPHVGTSMKDVFQSYPTLDKNACGDFEDILAIGPWQFFLRPDGWRFGHIGVNEFPESMKYLSLEP